MLAQWREWWDSAPAFYFYLLVVRWAHLQTHLSTMLLQAQGNKANRLLAEISKIVLYKENLFLVNWFIISICYSGGELSSLGSLSDKEDLKKNRRNLRRDQSCAIDIWLLPAVLRASTVSRRHTLKQASWRASRKSCYLCIVCSLPFIAQPCYYLLSFKKHSELLC